MGEHKYEKKNKRKQTLLKAVIKVALVTRYEISHLPVRRNWFSRSK